MPKNYDEVFRKKILEAYLQKEGSLRELAYRFKVSTSTVKRIARRYKETGTVEVYIYNAGRHELIDAQGKETLKKILTKTPDLTLREIQEKYEAIHQIKPVLTVFHNTLKKLKITYKKKSKFAQQQLREDVKKKEKNL
jgi:transposase